MYGSGSLTEMPSASGKRRKGESAGNSCNGGVQPDSQYAHS